MLTKYSDESPVENDLLLIDSEERLSGVGVEDCKPEEKLCLVLETLRMRDHALYSICSGLVRQLGVDYLCRGEVRDTSSLSSKELPQLLIVFRTFHHLGSMV